MQTPTLQELVDAGRIRGDIADKHVAEIKKHQTDHRSGYLAMFKNGIGPAFHGYELPFQQSVRWRDSYIVQLEQGRSADDLLAEAVVRATPV